MADLMATGIPGLDRILRGGLRPRTTLLLEGAPGTGKTTLGLQFILAGLQAGEAGLIVTFEQLPEELYRDARGLGWDLTAPEREGRLRVVATTPEVFLDQLSEVGGLVDRAVSECGARRLLLDSVSHLGQVTSEPAELRRLVYSMLNGLRRAGLTSVLTRELAGDGQSEAPFEEYLTENVIRLTHEIGRDRRRRRYLEVLKTRGVGHLSGKHAFRIGGGGLSVFPQPAPPTGLEASLPLGETVPTGAPGLDQMLGGGYPRGGACLLAGGAGVGKTLLGLQFLTEGLHEGEKALLVCFEERPEVLLSVAESCGMGLREAVREGRLTLLHHSPLDLIPEELFAELDQRLAEGGLSRLVVDGITDLELATQHYFDLRGLLLSLLERTRAQGVTVLLTREWPESLGVTLAAGEHLSILVDGVILLKHFEQEGMMRRALAVLKMRACRHDPAVRGYFIDHQGVRVSTGP